MTSETPAKTIGQLRDSGYKVLPIREEMRKNLISKIKAEELLFPGIIGFEDTVIPQLENAILAGQDVILLGERGQAKSRLIRSLVSLLDEYIPKIAECEINDNPYDPVCRFCRDKVAEQGEGLGTVPRSIFSIAWQDQPKTGCREPILALQNRIRFLSASSTASPH